MTPRPYQVESIDDLNAWLPANDGNPCVVLPTGCHAAGTPILMADGTIRPVEAIRVGDRLMGPKGPVTVTQLHCGDDQMYRVVPIRGDSFVVNVGHILTLYRTPESSDPRYPCERRGGELVDVSVRDWMGWTAYRKHIHKLIRCGVETFENPPPVPQEAGAIDAYSVGVLLGDGTFQGTVSVSKPDPEIAQWAGDFAMRNGLRLRTTRDERRCPAHLLSMPGACNKRPGFRGALRAIGIDRSSVAATKAVPACFKYAGRATRLELLAGLMDTDGHNNGKGGFDFISKSARLADDVVFLARSVGLSASLRPCEKGCQGGFRGVYYRVYIGGDVHIVPCRIARRRQSPRKAQKNTLVTGFHVEPIGVGEYFGFEVDGDHRYLLGDFTITHNSGKTILFACLLQQYLQTWPDTRVIVLAHVKELLEQGVDKLKAVWPQAPVGVYSAGLRRRDMRHPITFAGIQSVYRKACDFDPFDLIFVDEAHRIPLKNDGLYRQFIRDARLANPRVRVVGFTATPYRLDGGPICGPDNVLNEVCYEAKIPDLIADGFLCRLRSKGGHAVVDTSEVHIRKGEFVTAELEQSAERVVEAAVAEAVRMLEGRRSILFFCISVHHAHRVSQELAKHGIFAPVVEGNTEPGERRRLLQEFKAGRLRALCSIMVLSEGFDAPNIDAVVMLRPTASPGLYYQQVGRGFRLHPAKQDCLVLDFAGNIMRHGPIDAIDPRRKAAGEGPPPVKACPECDELVPIAVMECPACGHAFPPPEKPLHDTKPTNAQILSSSEPWTVEVRGVSVRAHHKAGKPTSLQVTYHGEYESHREWVCLEHPGFAGAKAAGWWRRRFGDPVPTTVDQALTENLFLGHRLATMTRWIRVCRDGQYTRILSTELTDDPVHATVA